MRVPFAALLLLAPDVEPALARAAASGPGVVTAPDAGSIASVVVSLVLVVGAILACGWLYRRTQGLRGAAGGGVFRIVASQALGQRERIVVVEVGGKQLVLGVTSAQVSALHVFDEPVVFAAAPRRPGGTDASFAERLKAIVRGGDGA